MNPSLARHRLNQALVCGLAFAPLSLLLGLFGLPIQLNLGFVLIAFGAFHVLLGLAAKAGGRSWILFGLVPLVLPFVGGFVAANILLKTQRRETLTGAEPRVPVFSPWPAVVTAVCLMVFWVAFGASAVIPTFSVWNSPFSMVFVVATICLPFAAIVGLLPALTLLRHGRRERPIFLSVLTCAAGLLTAIYWLALFTRGP